MKDIKFGMLVSTEFQLFSVLKFVQNNTEGSRNNADLFIYQEIPNYQEKIKKITKLNLFKNIFVVRKLYDSNSKFVRKIVTFSRGIRFSYFRKIMCPEVKSEHYLILMVGSYNHISQYFCNSFQHDYLYYIDDGLGSYNGNVHNTNIRPLNKLLMKTLHKYDEVEKLYVNCLGMCKSKISRSINQIPVSLENDNNCIKSIFEEEKDAVYKRGDLIYLRYPEKDVQTHFSKVDECIKKVCSKYKDDFIIRRHPRDINSPIKDEYRYDLVNNFWENVCANEIVDTNILIGDYSTAQFTPKVLFNKEPYVVFLFLLFPHSDNYKLEYMEVVKSLQEVYQDHSKVIIPKNIDDFKLALDGIVAERLKYINE